MWGGLNIFLWSYSLASLDVYNSRQSKISGSWNQWDSLTYSPLDRHLYVQDQKGSWINHVISQQETSFIGRNPCRNQQCSRRRHDRMFNCHSLLAEAKFCKCFAPGPREAGFRGGWHNWQCYSASDWRIAICITSPDCQEDADFDVDSSVPVGE
jgi:hypothetical protein